MLIKILTLIFVTLLITRVGAKLKKKELTPKESLFWGILWFAVGVVVLYPSLADRLAAAAGLQTATGIDLVVYVAVGVVFYLVFRLYIRLDRIEHNLTKLARHLALRDNDNERE